MKQSLAIALICVGMLMPCVSHAYDYDGTTSALVGPIYVYASGRVIFALQGSVQICGSAHPTILSAELKPGVVIDGITVSQAEVDRLLSTLLTAKAAGKTVRVSTMYTGSYLTSWTCTLAKVTID